MVARGNDSEAIKFSFAEVNIVTVVACDAAQSFNLLRHVYGSSQTICFQNTSLNYLWHIPPLRSSHLDIIGLLALSQGFRYCLAILDQFSRWFEALPIPDQTDETVVRVFHADWVSRYGILLVITTDQDTHF